MKSPLVSRLEGICGDALFASVPQRLFTVADFDARGDGETLDTGAIQSCIDAVASEGGGVITFPSGCYLSGALFLKSNTELRLDEGVTIRAVQDDDQYPEIWTRIAGVEMEWPAALININGQKNVRVSGKGTIDGNGKYWWDKFWGDPPLSGGMYREYIERDLRWAVDYDCKRVRAVVVYESEDVLLRDFTIKRSGFWTVTMTYCNRVHVDGLIVKNNIDGYGPSSDGINTDSSANILVENCDIDCNDDNLCIKAGKDADGLRVNRPSENVIYRNCITRSGHGLLTLGSETAGGIRNVEVYGLKAVGTTMGIRFKSAKVRGGVVEDVCFHHVEMEGVRYPFHFELNWYPEYSYPTIPSGFDDESIPDRWRALTLPLDTPELGIPEFKDIAFSDIVVSKAKQAFYVNAFPEKPMRGIRWSDIRIEAEEAGEIHHAYEWTMENVTLRLSGSQGIAIQNASEIGVPHYIFGDDSTGGKEPRRLDLEDLLWHAGRADPVLLDDNHEGIEAGATRYSEALTMLMGSQESTELRFLEPWGDGVVNSPVEIHYDPEGQQLTVRGERSHRWTIYLRMPEAENLVAVEGADAWDEEVPGGWLHLTKHGASFTIQIRTSKQN